MPTSRTRINADSRAVVGIGGSAWRALPARMGVTAPARMVAVSVFAIDSIVGSLLIESPATQCAALAAGERIRNRPAQPGGNLSIGAPLKTPRSCAGGTAAADPRFRPSRTGAPTPGPSATPRDAN